MDNYIPHIHTCEIKLCRSGSWKKYCPLNGELSETQDECEDCVHFVTINFDADNPLQIIEIIR